MAEHLGQRAFLPAACCPTLNRLLQDSQVQMMSMLKVSPIKPSSVESSSPSMCKICGLSKVCRTLWLTRKYASPLCQLFAVKWMNYSGVWFFRPLATETFHVNETV